MKFIIVIFLALLSLTPAHSAFLLSGTVDIDDGFTVQNQSFTAQVFGGGGPINTPSSQSYLSNYLVFNFSGPLGTTIFNHGSSSTTLFQYVPDKTLVTLASQAANSALSIQFETTAGLRMDQVATLNYNVANSPSYGTFSLTRSGQAYSGTFKSLSAQTSMPEPTTWAMLILGFGVIGAVARRDRRNALLPIPTI